MKRAGTDMDSYRRDVNNLLLLYSLLKSLGIRGSLRSKSYSSKESSWSDVKMQLRKALNLPFLDTLPRGKYILYYLSIYQSCSFL